MLPLTARAFTTSFIPIPSGCQFTPSHRATWRITVLPELVKLPPAYTVPSSATAIAFTGDVVDGVAIGRSQKHRVEIAGDIDRISTGCEGANVTVGAVAEFRP